MIRIKERVLEIWRVDIDLERRKDANLVLLEVERGKRAAGEIVADAAILHGRPVAHGAREKDARRSGQWEHLLQGLHAIKNAGAGSTNDCRFVWADHQDIALRFHGGIEFEVVAREAGLRCLGSATEERDAIGRAC